MAKKACGNACIGCSLCFKECKFEAITIADNLSYIDHTKCKLCRKCVVVCPTHAIHEIGFPPPKKEAPKEEASAGATPPSSTPEATPTAETTPPAPVAPATPSTPTAP